MFFYQSTQDRLTFRTGDGDSRHAGNLHSFRITVEGVHGFEMGPWELFLNLGLHVYLLLLILLSS